MNHETHTVQNDLLWPILEHVTANAEVIQYKCMEMHHFIAVVKQAAQSHRLRKTVYRIMSQSYEKFIDSFSQAIPILPFSIKHKRLACLRIF